MFKEDDDTAYAKYKAAYAANQTSKLSGHADFHYGVIGGALDLSSEHGSAMSKEDLGKTFHQAKSSFQQSASGSTSKRPEPYFELRDSHPRRGHHRGVIGLHAVEGIPSS